MRLCRVETSYKGEKKPVICNNPASEYRYAEVGQPSGETVCVELLFCQACAKRYDHGRIQVKYPKPPDPVSQSSHEGFQYVQYGGE